MRAKTKSRKYRTLLCINIKIDHSVKPNHMLFAYNFFIRELSTRKLVYSVSIYSYVYLYALQSALCIRYFLQNRVLCRMAKLSNLSSLCNIVNTVYCSHLQLYIFVWITKCTVPSVYFYKKCDQCSFNESIRKSIYYVNPYTVLWLLTTRN